MFSRVSESRARASTCKMVALARENSIESGRLASLFDSRRERPYSISRGNVSLQLRQKCFVNLHAGLQLRTCNHAFRF